MTSSATERQLKQSSWSVGFLRQFEGVVEEAETEAVRDEDVLMDR